MTIPDKIMQTIDRIFDGNCIVFTGAGFSLDAKNILDEKLLTADKLKNKIFDLVGLDHSGTLDWAVESYIEKFSERDLICLLRNLFFVTKIEDKHTEIISQNWKGIYTTNYDNIIETVFSDARKQVYSTTSVSKPSLYSNKRNIVVHINGFVENLNEDHDLPRDFLLHELSYITSNFINSDWHNHFQSDIVTSDAVFFIGFSMRSDLDIERVVYNSISQEKREKTIFIVWENEPQSSIKFLSKFGVVLPIGVEGFAQLLKERKAKYVPPQDNSLKLFSFSEHVPTSVINKITTSDVFDLLFYGRCNQAFVESSVANPTNNKYYFLRKQIELITQAINNEHRDILITSDLGNGKTLLIEGLKVRLHALQYKIFHFQNWYASAETEIQQICEKVPDAIIIIENYNNNIKLLDFLHTRRGNRITIITSERSSIHETNFHKLERYFGDSYLTYDLNILSEDDISQLVSILNEYGLWGDYANIIETEKIYLITQICHSSLREVLLKLIESKSIIDKFKDIIESLSARKNYFEAIVLLLTSKYFGINLSIEQLITILNDEKFRKPVFLNDPAIKELIDSSSGSIKVKSSILSEVLLAKASNAFSTVLALVNICKQLDMWTDDHVFKTLLKSYISYSNLYSLLKSDQENFTKAIHYFFDELRNLRFCRENPHYWLQYAILNLENNQLDLARKQFETAYSFAKRTSRFDTYQLDNQYARYLLLNQLSLNNPKSCMPALREAHKILTNSLSPNELKYYPYKVAQLYIDFHSAFFSKLTSEEKKEFLLFLRIMKDKISKYLQVADDHRIKRYVTQTQKAMTEILNKTS